MARTALVVAIAARVVWAAWSYYVRAAPRYPLETAAFALVAVGILLVVFRGGPTRQFDDPARFPFGALPFSIAAAFILYRPALGLGMLSDDFVLRAAATSGGSMTGVDGFFRPLPLVIWRVLFTAADSPGALHALNIAFHGLNAWLVGVLGARLGFSTWAAFAAASLFLTFPASPEAVAWASGIQDVLMTSGVLGAVIAAGSRSIGPWSVAAVGALSVAALLIKETAVVVPALIAACWLTSLRESPAATSIRLVVSATVAAIYAIYRASLGIRGGFFSMPSAFLVQHMMVTAFGSLAVPWRSPSSPAAAWRALLATVLVTGLVAGVSVIWRRDDVRFIRAVQLTLWIVLAVTPVYSYFYVDTKLEGARYLYLAECGWALLAVDLIWTVTGERPFDAFLRPMIVAALVAVSLVTLRRELSVWSRAADLRDRVLAQARRASNRAHCDRARFNHVPDSVDGAYVFRNGFDEAFGTGGAGSVVAAECRFDWQNDAFVVSR